MTATQSDRDHAGARYMAALIEFRAAYADLGALDRLLGGLPGFGPPPAVVPLRHSTFAPDVSGSFADDIREAIASRTT